jgi:hypothetical protein
MRALSPRSSPLRASQRGSAVVVLLVITIILFLVFLVLWFLEQEERQEAQNERTLAVETARVANQAALYFRDGWQELADVVGYKDKNVADMLPEGEAGANVTARDLAQGVVVTNLDKLRANLTVDGVIPGAEGTEAQPGLLNYLETNAQIQIAQRLRTGQAAGVAETPITFETMTPEFRAKLQEVNTLFGDIPDPPPGTDPANDQEYQAAVKRYQDAMDQLTAMKGWDQYSKIIQLPGELVEQPEGAVALDFFTQPTTPQPRVQDLLEVLKGPASMVERYNAEFRANKVADATRIQQVEEAIASLQTQHNDLQQQLAAEQQAHTTDVERLQGLLAEANQRVEEARTELINVQNQLAQVTESSRRTEAVLTRDIATRDEAIRTSRSTRDLAIRRDDPDGTVLSFSPTRETAIIDLGTVDKVFPGQKFSVWSTGRGGLRVVKATVQVIRVTGAHSSQVAVVESSGTPIGQGDRISNPLYSPNETIHVYLAGELTRYPRDVAASRLRQLNVVIDRELTGETDYVVIPNRLTIPTDMGEGGEEDGGEEEGPATQSEYERLVSRARSAGANVITEAVFEEWIGY